MVDRLSSKLKKPAIKKISLDTGLSSTDFVTSDDTPKVVGKTTKKAKIKIVVRDEDGNKIDVVKVKANKKGKFKYKSDGLEDGTYILTFKAKKGGKTKKFEETILIDTAGPAIVADQAFDYEENQTAGAALGKVSANDTNGVAAFAIIAGDSNGWFQIDDQGNISLTDAGEAAAANDWDDASWGTGPRTFNLTVEASDAAGNSVSKDIELEVLNTVDTTAEADLLAAIYEYSESDGDGGNGVAPTDDQMALLVDNVFKFVDDLGGSALELRYRKAINDKTDFTDPSTGPGAEAMRVELQALINDQNTNFKALFSDQGPFNEAFVIGWDVSQVTNMQATFKETSFNQDIGGWDVGNVTDMREMFELAPDFDQDISGWDVSRVEDMAGMFFGATGFNQAIGDWDVGNVTDMKGMFASADLFNQDLSDWDTSNVTDLDSMFRNASAFDQDISDWDITSLVDASKMLDGSGMSTANFDALLAGWSTDDSGVPGDGIDDVPENVTLGADGLTYTNAEDFTKLFGDFGWSIEDAVFIV